MTFCFSQDFAAPNMRQALMKFVTLRCPFLQLLSSSTGAICYFCVSGCSFKLYDFHYPGRDGGGMFVFLSAVWKFGRLIFPPPYISDAAFWVKNPETEKL